MLVALNFKDNFSYKLKQQKYREWHFQFLTDQIIMSDNPIGKKLSQLTPLILYLCYPNLDLHISK